MLDPEKTPVIVGVGQLNDRPQDPAEGLDPSELMAAALRAADADGGGGWLRDLDSLAIVSQLSFPHLNPLTESVTDAIGTTPRFAYQTATPSGDSPILLLNEAANRIAAGEVVVAAICGAEALRTAASHARELAAAGGKSHDVLRDAVHRRRKGYAQSHGLTVPVDVYPLYENACRAVYGQTLAQGQEETAEMWSLLSEVAAANPAAWIRRRVSPEDIRATGPDNRPIAFPYTKLTVANAAVNQGAGFIVTSLAEARRRGVDERRLVYVGLGAAAHEADDFLSRDRFDHSPSMAVSLRKTMKLNRLTVDDLDHVELYSCFPCVPKMARRTLGWPADRPISVVGGLTFGGGPIGNYMSHAVATMVAKLRSGGGTGLLFANGGYATHNHTIILTADPNPAALFPQDFDFQDEADAARGPIPAMDETYKGPATLETYTVHYNRDGSARMATIVARTPTGDRTLAVVDGDDASNIERLTDGTCEPVGASGLIEPAEKGMRYWRFSRS